MMRYFETESKKELVSSASGTLILIEPKVKRSQHNAVLPARRNSSVYSGNHLPSQKSHKFFFSKLGDTTTLECTWHALNLFFYIALQVILLAGLSRVVGGRSAIRVLFLNVILSKGTGIGYAVRSE